MALVLSFLRLLMSWYELIATLIPVVSMNCSPRIIIRISVYKDTQSNSQGQYDYGVDSTRIAALPQALASAQADLISTHSRQGRSL